MRFLDLFRKKKESSVDASERASSGADHVTRHCFVLCASVEPADLSRADSVVRDVFGRGYTADVSDKSIISVMHGDKTIGFLAHVPAPIPNAEAEENADDNILWPNGRDEAAKHLSHVIVTNIGCQEQTLVQSAITVTRLALVALKIFDGIGVYWGNASVCNSRAVFEDFCEDLSEEHFPIPMWLRFQLVRTSDNDTGLYTLGMRQFGLMEIEVDGCTMNVRELFEFVSNIALYLIESGPVIADGNTVGGSEEERILVRHRPSMIDNDRRVYKLVFEE